MALTLANQLTLARIVAVPVFVAVLLSYLPQNDYYRYVALAIFLFAVGTDILDGYVARHWQQKSAMGAILDPLADKLLLSSAFVCLHAIGELLPRERFPIWLVVTVISRDAMLLIGGALLMIAHGKVGISVSVWSKATTFFQGVSVVGLLLQWPGFRWVWFVAFILTVVSGLDYGRRGFELLNTPSQRK